MINKKRKSGFTLIEVLISAGILSVGFMLIAGAFPVGVKLTSMATERTIGSVTAQEAIAKIKIYGLDMSYRNPYYVDTSDPVDDGLTYGRCFDYSNIALLDWEAITAAPPYLGFIPVLPPEYEYYYPSTNLVAEKKYHWSALCRYLSYEQSSRSSQIQATIFVSRLGGPGLMYPANPIPEDSLVSGLVPPTELEYPQPYMIQGIIRDPDDARKLTIPDDYITYFREGAVIYDDINGYLFTIQKPTGADMIVELDRGWPYAYDNSVTGEIYEYNVWVLPSSIKKPGTGGSPAVLGGRWPCVWIFQDIIEVEDFSQIVPVVP